MKLLLLRAALAVVFFLCVVIGLRDSDPWHPGPLWWLIGFAAYFLEGTLKDRQFQIPKRGA